MSIRGEMVGKPLTNVLYGGAFSRRSDLDADLAPCLGGRQWSCRLQETPQEDFLLTVFAQKDDSCLPAHGAHPLAIRSESLSPGSPGPASVSRTVTTPDFSLRKV